MANKKRKSSVEKYTKRAFCDSHAYAQYRDLITAILEDGESYTVNEVDEAIDTFLQKGVK